MYLQNGSTYPGELGQYCVHEVSYSQSTRFRLHREWTQDLHGICDTPRALRTNVVASSARSSKTSRCKSRLQNNDRGS
jgi:hypothetical protein